jgi:hypothetical protein
MTIDPTTLISIIIGAFGAIITGVISYFLKDTIKTLKGGLSDALNKLNVHNEKLGLLEQSIITLNIAIAKMSDLELRIIQIEQNKTHELLAKDYESVKKDIEHIDKNVKQYVENTTNYFKLCDQNTQNIENLIKLSEKHEMKFQVYDENILKFYRDFEHTKNEHQS